MIDVSTSHSNTEKTIRSILKQNVFPLFLGGDHSITIPCIQSFSDTPIHVIQFDAHLDFVDSRHGVTQGHGNVIRRASEHDHVTGITQLGIRNVSSSSREDYLSAQTAGSDILSIRQIRKLGKDAILSRIPDNSNYYITIDIDGFDPSIAPGTGTPGHGGFYYYEVLELLQGISKKGTIVGLNLVEVSPSYDLAGITSILAAQILMNCLGFIFHERTSPKQSSYTDAPPIT